MTETELLQQADRIAEAAHVGQVDKVGAPYIAHPRRVSAAVDDTLNKVVTLVTGVFPQRALKGAKGKMLCVYDKRTK